MEPDRPTTFEPARREPAATPEPDRRDPAATAEPEAREPEATPEPPRRQPAASPAERGPAERGPADPGPGTLPPAVEPTTLLDLLDGAFQRFADRPALRLWLDDGTRATWTYRELDRRSRLAAWRLRGQLGLAPGERILTWSPSTPGLPAAYFGAMRAGLVLVPLDLRMSADAVQAIVGRAEPRHLILGTGPDAPDPDAAGLTAFPTTTVDDLTAEPGAAPGDAAAPFPEDWEASLAAWPRPRPEDIWDLIFTSGTTGTPKGVMVAHDNLLATLRAIDHVIPPLEHRVVSVLPLSHLFEQGIGLIYALSVGADILYVRSRNPRVLFEALRTHRVTSMIAVPQVLDVFWSAIERGVDRSGRRATFERLRALARHLPYPARRLIFRGVHARIGGGLRLFVSSGAFLPPALQQAWEDLGVVVMQGYGSSENGFGTCNTPHDHGLGTVGRPMPPVELRVAADGEVLFRGATLFKGYWRDPEATARAIDPDGWYHTGDLGHLDADGRLVLSGRTKDRIVLPNGFKVYPEDLENALRVAGLRDAVAIETAPGRIEAVILRRAADAELADRHAADAADDAAERAVVDASVRTANATLGPQQRIAGWRFWPDDDFPRTHTLKIRRDPIVAWARGEISGREGADRSDRADATRGTDPAPGAPAGERRGPGPGGGSPDETGSAPAAGLSSGR